MKTAHTKEVVSIIITAEKKTLNIDDLIVQTALTHKQVIRVMDRLEREGYIQTLKTDTHLRQFRESGVSKRYPVWQLNPQKILQRRAGSVRRPDTVRDKIWQAIRIKRKFTLPELEQFTQMKQDCLRDYIYILEAGGFLKRQPNTGKIKVFVLVNDPGKERPVLPERNKKTRLTQRREDADKDDSR